MIKTLRTLGIAYLFIAVVVSNYQVADYKKQQTLRGYGNHHVTKAAAGLVFTRSIKSFFFIN